MQVLHPDLLNENMVRAEYAVRGELYLTGEELRKKGREIIFTNGEAQCYSGAMHTIVKAHPHKNASLTQQLPCGAVGNPHVLGQKPLSFNRQVSPWLCSIHHLMSGV
jgi:glutamate--glyoxylate aminotransferase